MLFDIFKMLAEMEDQIKGDVRVTVSKPDGVTLRFLVIWPGFELPRRLSMFEVLSSRLDNQFYIDLIVSKANRFYEEKINGTTAKSSSSGK